MNIVNLNHVPFSNKNGMYGGNAGQKDGIVYMDNNWMVKYPKYVKNMERVECSYSTAPLSEYLGSHIFQILGYETHDTILGERRGKIVVACKDLETDGKKLIEMRTVKNHANEYLSDLLEKSVEDTGDAHYVDFDTLVIHMNHNPILNRIDGIWERFWEQAVVDIYINNSDRNNGNWGFLRDTEGKDVLAPVFDNGGSFQDKLSEEKIKRILGNREQAQKNACNTQTVYAIDGHILSVIKFLELAEEFDGLSNAILKVVPLIQEKRDEIKKMFDEIPSIHVLENGKTETVCSEERKELFLLQMDSRMENLLLPAYEKALARKKEEMENSHEER